MYTTNDGVTLKSSVAADVVRELNRLSHTPAKSDSDFMRQAADRISAKLGVQVRYARADEFVGDLVDAGLLILDDMSYPLI